MPNQTPQLKKIALDQQLAKKTNNKNSVINSNAAIFARNKKKIVNSQNKAKQSHKLQAYFNKIFGKVATTAQESINYLSMYQDGLCQIDSRTYNKTIEFGDINYELASDEKKGHIFANFCKLHNLFDETKSFEFTYANKKINDSFIDEKYVIPHRNDGIDDMRDEHAEYVREEISKGNNGIERKKYLTFNIKADNLKQAKQRAENLQAKVTHMFGLMQVTTRALNGKQRLKILHDNLNPKEPFFFDWKEMHRLGLSTKDMIAPTSFVFDNIRYLK